MVIPLQHAQAYLVPSAMAQQKLSQNRVEQCPNLTAEEQLSLKQQQSLEMVQIMLHVSVSLLHLVSEITSLINPILDRSGLCSTFGLSLRAFALNRP